MKDPDRELVRRLRAGDEVAFTEIFDDYFPRLYRYVLARVDGNLDDARDIVQQTFCRAFEHIDSYRGEASLFGWMCRIARNQLIDRSRHRARWSAIPAITHGDDTFEVLVETLCAPPSDEPDEALARFRLVELIQSALDCLPTRYGDALEWKYVEGLPVTAIADRLGIGTKAAESLLSRARAAFREAILDLGDSAELLPGHTRPTLAR